VTWNFWTESNPCTEVPHFSTAASADKLFLSNQGPEGHLSYPLSRSRFLSAVVWLCSCHQSSSLLETLIFRSYRSNTLIDRAFESQETATSRIWRTTPIVRQVGTRRAVVSRRGFAHLHAVFPKKRKLHHEEELGDEVSMPCTLGVWLFSSCRNDAE